MKVAVAALLLIVAALAWLLNAEMTRNREQRDQIRKLTASLADKSKPERLEPMGKCAAQAEKMSQKLGLDGSYVSHYNAKLDKCFMTARSRTSSSKPKITEALYDADQGREYAVIQESRREGKGRIFEDCVIKTEGKPRQCDSRQDYDSFVAEFMER